jgi:hypothetical protein
VAAQTSGLPVLSVVRTRDGVWSVNERGPGRVAVAYFPSKWGALKHAVKAARAKQRARIAILESGGKVETTRDYASVAPAGGPPEVP